MPRGQNGFVSNSTVPQSLRTCVVSICVGAWRDDRVAEAVLPFGMPRMLDGHF